MSTTSPQAVTTTPSPQIESTVSADEVASTAPINPPSTSPPPAPTESTDPEPEPKPLASPTTTSPPQQQITSTASPSLPITVLLQSGARQQFTLDEQYLARHGVKSASGKESDNLRNPFDMTVWQLKECIWKDWKEDWDQRPASALFIKLIQFGAYLTDSNSLRDCRITTRGPNVIHMAIRPAEAGDDDMTQRSTKGAFHRSGDREGTGPGRSPSCRCVIL